MKINGQPLHKLKKAYRQARKACGMLNTLPDSAFRTMQRSKLFKNMNRLRAAIRRAVVEYKNVVIDHTNAHGFHIYINGVKSKGYATIAEVKQLIDALIMRHKSKNQTIKVA